MELLASLDIHLPLVSADILALVNLVSADIVQHPDSQDILDLVLHRASVDTVVHLDSVDTVEYQALVDTAARLVSVDTAARLVSVDTLVLDSPVSLDIQV